MSQNTNDAVGGPSHSNVGIDAYQSLHNDAYRYRWMRAHISADLEWFLLGRHGMGPNGLDEPIDRARKATNFDANAALAERSAEPKAE